MRCRDGDDDARLADAHAADPVVDRDLAELVTRAQPVGDLGHHLLGHPFVGFVLEVRHDPAARVDARRPDERRDRAGLLGRDLLDDHLHGQRLLAQHERAPGDRRNQRHLVAVAELAVARDVHLVHGIQQPRRLVAQPERGPDVRDALDAVELTRREARPFAQAGEESHGHLHAATE